MSDDHPVPPQLTKLLDAWAKGAEAGPGGFDRLTHCGGALVRVSADEAQQLEEMDGPGAIRFVIPVDRIPHDGQRHDWRVRCRGEITVDKQGYRSALCPRCEGTERAFRAKARQRLDEKEKLAAGKSQSRTKRGDYDR